MFRPSGGVVVPELRLEIHPKDGSVLAISTVQFDSRLACVEIPERPKALERVCIRVERSPYLVGTRVIVENPQDPLAPGFDLRFSLVKSPNSGLIIHAQLDLEHVDETPLLFSALGARYSHSAQCPVLRGGVLVRRCCVGAYRDFAQCIRYLEALAGTPDRLAQLALEESELSAPRAVVEYQRKRVWGEALYSLNKLLRASVERRSDVLERSMAVFGV